MSETSAAPVPTAPARPPSRTFLRRVLSETFVRLGARLGLIWIVILAIAAIFAPFISNSRPFLIKMDGEWSSPMLAGLNVADIALLCMFIAAVVMWFIKTLRPLRRALIVIGVGLIASIVSWQTVSDEGGINFAQYRRAQADGRVDFVLNAPIPYSPRDRLRDFPAIGNVGPWWAPSKTVSKEDRYIRGHWLGNEANGADLASRMIHAARIALAIGFIATGIAMTIGVILGGVMGYYSGRADLIGMRIVEIVEFIPTLFLLLMFVAFYGRNIYFIMVIIGMTTWPGYARFTRAEFLKLRKQDYVQAAIACGLPLRSILFRHMLPNGITPILVSASFGVASAILYEATLSFLGLGVVDEPSWGELLNQAVKATGSFVWWIAIFPGGAIFLTVFAYNLIGEALRDAIDPHLKKSAHL